MSKGFVKRTQVLLVMLVMIVLMACPTGVFAASDDSVVSVPKVAETDIGVAYRGHVENYGNMPKPEGSMINGPEAIGTRGQGLRVEGFWIELTGDVPEAASIHYQVHVENEGWMEAVSDGEFAGTHGRGLRVESIKIWLEDLPGYSVYYRGHVQNRGNIPLTEDEWTWVKDGQEMGTTGSGLRLEELQVKIVKEEVDLTAHDELLTTISQLKEDDYSADSWEALKEAITGNEVTLANTQAEIDQATKVIEEAYKALEKLEATVYDKAGTFGPESGSQTIEGNVIVKADGVVLQNLVVTGNLIIAEEVGDGDVTLNNITVEGSTIVRGGGVNSIHINGGQYHSVVIYKTPEGAVRVVATDANGVKVEIANESEGDEIILEGDFDSVEVQAPDVIVQTKGGTIGQLNVAAGSEGCEIQMDETSTVKKAVFNEGAAVKGKGTVEESEVKADNVTYEKEPKQQIVDEGVSAPKLVEPEAPQDPDEPEDDPAPGPAPGPAPTPTPTPDPRPTPPSAEDLLVAEFTNAKDNLTLRNLLLKNELDLVMTGYYDLDYQGESIVIKNLLDQDSFASKAEIQAAVTEGIRLANEDDQAKAYMEALFSYTPVLEYDQNKRYLIYPEQLTDSQSSWLSGLYADLVINIDQPLEDGEFFELVVNGQSKQISNQEFTGTEVLLSRLMGRQLTDADLIKNQHATFSVSFNDVSTTIKRRISVCPVTTADSDKYFKNFTSAYSIELRPFWQEAYFDSIEAGGENSEFWFNYSGNLTEDQKQGLAGYYADTIIYFYRKLEADETITVSAMGKEALLNSDSDIEIDNEKGCYCISLSKLLDVNLGDDNLAANQQGDQKINFKDIKLDSELFVAAEAVLTNGDDERIWTEKGWGDYFYPDWLSEYMTTVSLFEEDNKVTVNYEGNLSDAGQAILNDYQADVVIYLDRPLEDGEIITISAFGKKEALNKDNAAEYQNIQFRLSELLKINPQAAADKRGMDEIEFTVSGLNNDFYVSIHPVLVKDNKEIFLNSGGGIYLQESKYLAYDNSVEIDASSDSKTITVIHKGGLNEEVVAGLDGLYEVPAIFFKRPLEADESVKVSAYGKEAVIGSSIFAEHKDQRIALTELLGISPDQAPMVKAQGEDIVIRFSEANLNNNLDIYAEKGLIKADGSWAYYSNVGWGINIRSQSVDMYEDNLTLTSDEKKISVKYEEELSPEIKAGLADYYADVMINLNRPLEEGEEVIVNAFGQDIQVNSSMVTDEGGRQIRLSQLLGISLGEAQLAANQTGGFDIILLENSLKSNLQVSVNAILVKGNELLYLDKSTYLEIIPPVFEAYDNSVEIEANSDSKTITVIHKGRLNEEVVAGLDGLYEVPAILFDRPLEAGESLKISAYGKEAVFGSSIFADREDRSIALTELLGISPDQAPLLTAQGSDITINFSEVNLQKEIGVFAEKGLIKADGSWAYHSSTGWGFSIMTQSMEAYEDNLTLTADNNKILIKYEKELSPEVKAGLEDCYADAIIQLNRPLVDGEDVTVNAFGQDIVIDSNMITDGDGMEIRLSDLLGITLGNDQLAANQTGEFEIAVTDNQLKSDLYIWTYAVLVKGDDLLYLNKWADMYIVSQSFEEARQAYSDSLSVWAEDNTFKVSYAGNLTDTEKAGLNGYYADAMINLTRPLVEGEEIIVNAFGQEIAVDSSTITDIGGIQIRLSDLLGITLGEDQLAANQTGGFEITVTATGLQSELLIMADPLLVKGEDMLPLGKMTDMFLQPGLESSVIEAFKNNLYPYAMENTMYIEQVDELSEDVKTALDGYYLDGMISLGRSLAEGETITINAFGNSATINSGTITEGEIRLSELMGITLGDVQSAADQSAGLAVAVTNNTLQTNIEIETSAVLVKGDQIESVGTGEMMYLNCAAFEAAESAYQEGLTVSADGNTFTVSYAGDLTDTQKAALEGYYADAMIMLERPLESGEEVVVNAFGQDILVNSSMITDDGGRQIRLSDLLGITLGDENLAANQTGGFDISLTDYSLTTDLLITVNAMLVKEYDWCWLDNYAVMTLYDPTAVLTSAKNYQYSDDSAYSYSGSIEVSGSNVSISYDSAEAAGPDYQNVMYDMARYLGALYWFDEGMTINTVTYKGQSYTWNSEDSGSLKGSNWYGNGATLISVITDDFQSGAITNQVSLGIIDKYGYEQNVILSFNIL